MQVGQVVRQGDVLISGATKAKVAKDGTKSTKTTDIKSTLAGTVTMINTKGVGVVEVEVTSSVAEFEQKTYPVTYGSRLRVQEGDHVEAGDILIEGSINPHDLLRILGQSAVQDYLLKEVLSVYRLQGVAVADKHIEIIVRQMLRKVRVEDNGDTVMFAPGEPFYGTPGKGKNEIRIAYVLKQADLERAMDLLAKGIAAYNAR